MTTEPTQPETGQLLRRISIDVNIGCPFPASPFPDRRAGAAAAHAITAITPSRS